ncbi:hypothetical protein GCM10020331_050090 [Ectobacillus funiculus]
MKMFVSKDAAAWYKKTNFTYSKAMPFDFCAIRRLQYSTKKGLSLGIRKDFPVNPAAQITEKWCNLFFH